MIQLAEVGAFPFFDLFGQPGVRFGVYLPGIRGTNNFEVRVRVIHTLDRYDPAVPAATFLLQWQSGSSLDLWSGTVMLSPVAGTHFGQIGMHLYRYELWWTSPAGQTQCVSSWITDPFARATEIGRMSAFTLDPAVMPFSWTDSAYKTPELDDLIVYELQVEEFNDTFDGVADRLIYLQSLGVNCLELMPVTSMKLDFDWGYGPLHFFAPSHRFGGPDGLKRLVDAAHGLGMAVILDVVYEHVDTMFPYSSVYNSIARTAGTPTVANPMMDGLNVYGFGPKPDHTLAFTQDYFQTANRYWLDEYRVDGFRYDEVTDWYVPPMDAGYRTLVEQTYRYSLTLSRFQGTSGGYSRIVQCAEALGQAKKVLSESFTNCAWQNGLLDQAEAVTSGSAPTDDYAHQLDPSFLGFPSTAIGVDAMGNPVQMPVAPFQYIESHDHSQLIVFAGTGQDRGDAIPEGDRTQFYQLQPHAIALYTLQGIPMLWQGQEFADNYGLPDTGLSRVHLDRNTHWEYFYDQYGAPLVNLYRRLGTLRRTVAALRSRSSYYYWLQSLQGTRVILYSRHAIASGATAESWALVSLNFSGADAQVNASFPAAGTWREMLDDSFRSVPLQLVASQAGAMMSLEVPSNYGQIWVKTS